MVAVAIVQRLAADRRGRSTLASCIRSKSPTNCMQPEGKATLTEFCCCCSLQICRWDSSVYSSPSLAQRATKGILTLVLFEGCVLFLVCNSFIAFIFIVKLSSICLLSAIICSFRVTCYLSSCLSSATSSLSRKVPFSLPTKGRLRMTVSSVRLPAILLPLRLSRPNAIKTLRAS